MRILSKIKGMFIGIALGDALGMPVETYTKAAILDRFPEGVKDFESPELNEYFRGQNLPIGSVTDDTQLTLAVANALIEAEGFDMETIVIEHIEAFKKPIGWGTTTKEAVQRLRDGIHWKESASPSTPKKQRGVGNGVPMKVAPLAAYHFLNESSWKDIVAETLVFNNMTHNTSMSASAAFVHNWAIQYCLDKEPGAFDKKEFVELIIKRSPIAELFTPVRHGQDNITDRIRELRNFNEYTQDQIIEKFGGGSCYVYDSLPFTYMFFLQNPTVNCVFDLANAGGDTDSNASMAGALVGALHGFEVWPEKLVDKLPDKQVVLDVATQFCETFC